MSVVVCAYHDMGCEYTQALVDRGVEISAAYTHPDNPDENCWFRSMSRFFFTHNPDRSPTVEDLNRLNPDVLFSFSYRKILPKKILDIPKYGCVNIHPSLLPKYRGRCPINWQLLYGEEVSGVTLHYMTEEVDAGPIIGQTTVKIDPDDNALSLYRKLMKAGRRLLEAHLDAILDGTVRGYAEPQPAFGVDISWPGRRPEQGDIGKELWCRGQWVHDKVRALAPPWPGAFIDCPDGRLYIDKTRFVPK